MKGCYLLDTCVLSELTKLAPSPLVIDWIERYADSSCYISALTIGELTRGIRLLPSTAKREKLEAWLQNDLLLRFKDKIIAIDEAVAIHWGVLVAESGMKGHILPTIDSLLAATALTHALTIVTRNSKDFHHHGLKILNPWSLL